MNAVLPTGIESYLKEAGFSATEMLILRKLVEEDSLTIREIAAKTGKSTGVLDQAMKKLLVKRIAQRNIINDQPRYSIQSLDSVVKWVKNDMQLRKEVLDRKHQNFEQFIASLKVDKQRPDIEYFNGIAGIQQAYLKLLESGQEFLTMMPVIPEEDPLQLFRVELFRKRQVRKIFHRVLAADSSLARRYQSRDPFEYRKTLLLPESELPLTFEKTIVGDTIACINLKEETACFLRYPELAKTEHAFFETLWSRAQTHHTSIAADSSLAIDAIPLSTQILSSGREFLLSRKSIVAFALFALLAGALTFGLFKTNQQWNFRQMQEKATTIAVTGVLQIDPKDLDQIRTEEDWRKPEWKKVITTMVNIREQNKDVLFVYIIRKDPKDPSKVQFVADSHSLNPYANVDTDTTNDVDVNGNGIIENDGADALQWPGMPYDSAPVEAFQSFNGAPSASRFYEDQWGKVVTAYAPIKNEKGETTSVFAVDIEASKLNEMSQQSFVPLYVFGALFICFIIARFFEWGWVMRSRTVSSTSRRS